MLRPKDKTAQNENTGTEHMKRPHYLHQNYLNSMTWTKLICLTSSVPVQLTVSIQALFFSSTHP